MLSVIVPVHNGEAYLQEALESILAAYPVPPEIIVADDGSTDRTPEIARSFSAVDYLRQEHAGPSAARNLGVQRARGEWLAFLDADDTWTREHGSDLLPWLESHPDFAGVFGWVEQFISPELSSVEAERLICPSAPQRAQLPGCLLLRRNVFDQVGPFCCNYRAGEFIDWCLRAQEQGHQFGEVDSVVLRRRLHLTNLGRVHRDARQDYARIALAALRRRRAQGLD